LLIDNCETGKDSLLQKKYERINKCQGKKRTIIVIARIILTVIYRMFINSEEFNPFDLYKIDIPQEMKNRQKYKAVKLTYKVSYC